MSELNTKATVTLNVNGQQAEETLQKLRANALNLESAIAKAAAAGNKTDLKRLRRELTDTKRQIREIESATQQVENVMRHLDKATPKELQKTLATLNKQLDLIERGTPAWDAHCAKIKMVKAEIQAVNMHLRDTESFWTRFNRVMNDWQTTIMGAAAAVTGLVMAGRSAVNAYAEMDEELANTRKYTGLTVDEVEELNTAFKNMSTRSSRAQLNELAQEAGRLGKNTIEDVKGYVEAADIINVALVDLGNGATQTIAKLSNIFGVEKDMGTRDAMLSVGSAVNVLSQNCTASKQYLVEFTQRMAGVGAQADLTIPQLLAFGATLDANGQKTEMSASALGKLTMMLFQKPGEVAAQVGLDVEKFTEVLKTSTNDGLIMFLERIQQLGSKDGLAVLAPLFKDLGMDGVRMSQVLATLAEHLDMVKWEQEEANKAFKEASSASHEYEIFNNTVQAGLDKAKKRIAELSVELGEKLLPIMRHVYSSTSLTLRFLSLVVDFVIKYHKEIISGTAALVAYKVAINASNLAFKAHYAWVTLTQAAHKAGAAVMATYRTAVLYCSVAYNKLTGNLERAAAAQRALNSAQKANLWGLIAAAIAAVIVYLIQYEKELTQEQKIEKEMKGIKAEATKQMEEERLQLNLLRDAAMNENLTLDERKAAIERLNGIIPDYNAYLDETSGKYVENKVALDEYINSLVRKYEIEGAEDKLKAIGKAKTDLNLEMNTKQKEKSELEEKAAKEIDANKKKPQQATGHGRSAVDTDLGYIYDTANASWDAAIEKKQAEIDAIDKQLREQEALEKQIMEVYGKDLQKAAIKQAAVVEDNSDPDFDPNAEDPKNKFAAEKEWKEREDALNRIAYAKGEKSYLAYTQRMNEIEIEFNQKKLKHTDLTATERLTIEASYYEALKKQSDAAHKQTVEEENASYNEQMAVLKQKFIDSEMTYEVYEEAIEQLDITHLNNLKNLQEEGSKERLNTEKQLQDKLLANQRKHQKEYEAAEKKHQDQLAKMKASYFGDNPQERQAKFDADMALLKEVYNAELAAAGDNAKEKLRIEEAFQKARLALMRKYNIEGADENMNFFEKWNDSVIEFLDSDLGSAISGSIDTLVSGMASIFQQMTTILQAELQIQTSNIERRYDREISLAEGNNFKVKRLEKQKEAEIAKAKKESNRKMFAMQVIQAVAQTASAAINAYSSAAAVPMVGYILAPIAAGMAIAAGAMQVAAIKKQQQASEAQGYSKGGFTKDGAVDEIAGVVHAGEWVASQSLTKNPRTRPLIEALDYAQRTNTIGNISSEDVSRSITAPAVLAQSAQSQAPQRVIIENNATVPEASPSGKELAEVLTSLKQRLDEPFITVNSVTGDTGMKQAQDEYDRLIRNKTPKYRR